MVFELFKADLPVDRVRLRLCRVLHVRFVQQILDAEQNLFDRDGRTPVFLVVQQRQADRAARVDVRVEQRRLELTLRRRRWIVVLEVHLQLVEASFPCSLISKKRAQNTQLVEVEFTAKWFE